jgi:hypothetical protein
MASSQQARRSRKAANPLSLSGADPLSALARSAALGGQNAMLLRLLLSSQARQAAGVCWWAVILGSGAGLMAGSLSSGPLPPTTSGLSSPLLCCTRHALQKAWVCSRAPSFEPPLLQPPQWTAAAAAWCLGTGRLRLRYSARGTH